MIALYGPRIEQCKWCFENHEMIRVAKIEDKDQPPLEKKTLNVKKMRESRKKPRAMIELEKGDEDDEYVKIDGFWYEYL